MAKRRGFFRRASRRAGRSMTRYARKGASSPLGMILPAVGYGAARPYLAKLVQPLADKIPVGNYGDELILGVAAFLAAKKGSGIIRDIGRAALTVEAASVGFQVSQGMTGGTSGGNGLPYY